MEAMEKSGFSNFKPDIDNLLLNIEKEAGNAAQNKKRKIEENENDLEKEGIYCMLVGNANRKTLIL